MVQRHSGFRSGHACSGDAIGVATAEVGDSPQRLFRSVGGRDQYRRDTMLAGGFDERHGLESGHVRDQHAVHSGLGGGPVEGPKSEEHTSELQSLMRISYAVFCLKKKKKDK